MAFTQLQRVALAQASKISHTLNDQLHKLSREHDFVGPLCEFHTPANNLSQDIQTLNEILRALQAETQ